MPEHQTTAMSAKLSLLFDLKLQRQFQVQSSLGELDDSSQPIDFPIVLNFDGFETGEQPPPGLAPEWIDVHNLGDIWHVSYHGPQELFWASLYKEDGAIAGGVLFDSFINGTREKNENLTVVYQVLEKHVDQAMSLIK